MTHDQRISELNQAIAASEQRRAEIQAKRDASLLAASDSEIAILDSEIVELQRRIAVTRQRIAAVKQAQTDEAEQQHQERLDALAAKAERARAIGVKKLAEYAKRAPAVAEILNDLAAIDTFLAVTNRTLTANGRQAIASPNATRCRSYERVERIERRRVGIGDALDSARKKDDSAAR